MSERGFSSAVILPLPGLLKAGPGPRGAGGPGSHPGSRPAGCDAARKIISEPAVTRAVFSSAGQRLAKPPRATSCSFEQRCGET